VGIQEKLIAVCNLFLCFAVLPLNCKTQLHEKNMAVAVNSLLHPIGEPNHYTKGSGH
jgi:hypothetical protein